jgi:heme A synthase
MERSRLHLYALIVNFCALLLVMTGAALTSSQIQTKPAVNTIALFGNVHNGVATTVALLSIGLAIWLSRAEKRTWLISLGWITSAAVILDGWLGWLTRGSHATPQPPAGALGTLHACLAALVFVAFASIALATSRTWACDPELVQDYGWPSLRSLSAFAAFLVAVQVGFGAAFRHNLVSVMPHLLGALVVALFIMIVGAFASNQFPKHGSLRWMAVTLMVITGIQVFLGMTAFIMRLMVTGTTVSTAYLTISVAHVATGSLTLAASTLLAIEIRRCVRPRDQTPPVGAGV